MEASMVTVVAVDDAVEHPDRVARPFQGQRRTALEQDRRPASPGQGIGEGTAGEPAADDGDRQTGSR